MDEWQECRTTIGRMDTILEDLRKFGFSLVTGLLTASAIAGVATDNAKLLPLASLVVMVLVWVLFGIDLYYQVLLSGAAERAMDLEFKSAAPELRLSKTVSDTLRKAHAVSAIFTLYLVFLLTAFLVGLVGTDTLVSRWWVVIVGALLFVTMTTYWYFVRRTTGLHTEKNRGNAWPQD